MIYEVGLSLNMKHVMDKNRDAVEGINLIPLVDLKKQKEESVGSPFYKNEGSILSPEEQKTAKNGTEKVHFTKESIALLVQTSEESTRTPLWRSICYILAIAAIFCLIWHLLGFDLWKIKTVLAGFIIFSLGYVIARAQYNRARLDSAMSDYYRSR